MGTGGCRSPSGWSGEARGFGGGGVADDDLLDRGEGVSPRGELAEQGGGALVAVSPLFLAGVGLGTGENDCQGHQAGLAGVGFYQRGQGVGARSTPRSVWARSLPPDIADDTENR